MKINYNNVFYIKYIYNIGFFIYKFLFYSDVFLQLYIYVR